MNRRVAVVLGLVLAACIGASLAKGDRNRAPQQQKPYVVAGQEPVDQAKPLPLAAVRAPEGLGELALARVRKLTGFGPRHSGKTPTPGWSAQVEYITAALHDMRLEVDQDTWTDRRELITFTNIRATIRGKREERIVLACHHDTKCTQGHADPANNFPFVGANDGGSGVALLLELANTLVLRDNVATIELVFFDGEESLDWSWNSGQRAMFGSKRFVQRHRDAELMGSTPKIAAMVLLDMVGRKDLHIQEELHSTLDLRRILWSAAVACGHQQQFFRFAEAASDDHKPFLDVGIPAVDLIDLKGNPNWHNATDTVDNMSAASLQKVADVVLTMLPAIEAQYVTASH